ncbi:MAG: PH domain-containing protein [Myxococcales bacterium]|nr:PH domain-containing protein [Myxococcales bacterium]
MAAQVFRFAPGRLTRNLVGLLPLAGFPWVLQLIGPVDPLLWIVFGALGAALVAAVLFSAARYKLTIDATGLTARGRLGRRRVEFADIRQARVRRGRGKPLRFMGPPPFRELVLEAGGKRLVISSLPLGEEAFNEVLSLLADRLPPPALAEVAAG